MEMVHAYERDPYMQTLETEVVRAHAEGGRTAVVLADTVLYPEGGGQPADRGWISGVAVADVRTVGGEIRHYLNGPPPTGAADILLDWDRRFDHMQQHTGQHLLTALALERFGWQTTAFHLGPQISDIELDTSGLSPEQLTALEDAVAAEIRAARPVTARRVRPEEYAALPVRSRGLPVGFSGDIRLVEIAGIDLNTCGGTHVRSTAEIEALKLLGTEGLRGGTRLFYVAGVRLRRLLAAHHDRMAGMRKLLGARDDELTAGLQAKLDALRDLQRALKTTEEELAEVAGRTLALGPDQVASAHYPGRDLVFLQRVAREFAQHAPDRVALFTAGDAEEGVFLLACGEHSSIDLPAAGRSVAEILNGRGGGSGRTFQGKAAALSRRAEALARLRAS